MIRIKEKEQKDIPEKNQETEKEKINKENFSSYTHCLTSTEFENKKKILALCDILNT